MALLVSEVQLKNFFLAIHHPLPSFLTVNLVSSLLPILVTKPQSLDISLTVSPPVPSSTLLVTVVTSQQGSDPSIYLDFLSPHEYTLCQHELGTTFSHRDLPSLLNSEMLSGQDHVTSLPVFPVFDCPVHNSCGVGGGLEFKFDSQDQEGCHQAKGFHFTKISLQPLGVLRACVGIRGFLSSCLFNLPKCLLPMPGENLNLCMVMHEHMKLLPQLLETKRSPEEKSVMCII